MPILKFLFNHFGDHDRHPPPPQGNDPLADPIVAAMSLKELADLPLIPENLGRMVDERKPRFAECA